MPILQQQSSVRQECHRMPKLQPKTIYRSFCCRLICKKCTIRRMSDSILMTKGSDQACITGLARARGIQNYEFTKQEFARLEREAARIGMKEDLVEQFRLAFTHMHSCPKWMRKGTLIRSVAGAGMPLWKIMLQSQKQ